MKKRNLCKIFIATLLTSTLIGCGTEKSTTELEPSLEFTEENNLVTSETETVNTVVDVNGVTITFADDAEMITQDEGNTVVFIDTDDEENSNTVNISVFDAADYADQIQMVKEKNHENIDANGNTYWTATHTEENAVFAAYEDEKFIVISWDGDKNILDKIKYCLN